LDCWINDALYTSLGTIGNYNANADIHNLYFTVAHAVGFSVFTGRILATDFITLLLPFQITHEVLFSQPNSFLAVFSVTFDYNIQNSTRFSTTTSEDELFFKPLYKNHAENTASIKRRVYIREILFYNGLCISGRL
jgi:hypothetical protein